MAHEIQADYASGNTLYAVIRDSTGQVWCVAGESFEDWGADGRAAGDYDIALADAGGSHYVGDFDASIPGGSYSIQVFRQVGVNPADTDPLVTSRPFLWTGNGESAGFVVTAKHWPAPPVAMIV